MKSTMITVIAVVIILLSCQKSDDNTPPPDNGPIAGTYSFTGSTTTTFDTTQGSGITTIFEYSTTTSNLKGTLNITGDIISSSGLMFDFVTTGTRKEINTSTGAVTNTTLTPQSGSSGTTSTAYSKTYSINTSSGELIIDDAQYLFCPAFILQPANKKYKYSLTGNTLKITSEYYAKSTSSHRSINQATFEKQ